jgi:hypothetical protein
MSSVDELRKLGEFPAVEEYKKQRELTTTPWANDLVRSSVADAALEELIGALGTSEIQRQMQQDRAEQAEARADTWEQTARHRTAQVEQAEARAKALECCPHCVHIETYNAGSDEEFKECALIRAIPWEEIRDDWDYMDGVCYFDPPRWGGEDGMSAEMEAFAARGARIAELEAEVLALTEALARMDVRAVKAEAEVARLEWMLEHFESIGNTPEYRADLAARYEASRDA